MLRIGLLTGTTLMTAHRSPLSGQSALEDEALLELSKTVTLQRNLLILVVIIALTVSMVMLLRLYHTTLYKTLSPFVIEIEERTGLTKVITPVSLERYANDEAVRNFYIHWYITVRESYSLASFPYYYDVVVAALSTESVFWKFKGFLSQTRDKVKNPPPEAQRSLVRLDSNQDVTVTIKAIKPLLEGSHNIPGTVVQVYFTQFAPGNSYAPPRERIATIGYDFNKTSMSPESLDVNPLRFQVLYYSLTDVSTEKM